MNFFLSKKLNFTLEDFGNLINSSNNLATNSSFFDQSLILLRQDTLKSSMKLK